MENKYNKKISINMKSLITLTFVVLFSQTVISQSNTTMNKARAMYSTAELLYESGKYTKVIEKIEAIETLLNGSKLESAQNLKIKALVASGQFQKAQKELNILYSLEPDDDIFKDIAQYSIKIDEGLIQNKLAAQAKIAQGKRLEQKKIATDEAYKYFESKHCTKCKYGKIKTYADVTCKSCKGKGRHKSWVQNKDGSYGTFECHDCQGAGKRRRAKYNTCSSCEGESVIYTYKGNFNFSDYDIKKIVTTQKEKIKEYNQQK